MVSRLSDCGQVRSKSSDGGDDGDDETPCC